MADIIGRAGRFVGDAVREAARKHADDEHQDGFDAAADIALRRIQGRTDALKKQMKSGPGLTKTEQLVFTELEELRSEMESDFTLYWRDTGRDWRPATT